LFGLDHKVDQALLAILPVAWEGGTSQGSGTANSFGGLLEASRYVDLFHETCGESYRAGIAFDQSLLNSTEALQRRCAEGDSGSRRDEIYHDVFTEVSVNTQKVLQRNALPLVLGGDHSSPLGAMLAVDKKLSGSSWGILHLDAHLDMRSSYEGMTNSHASIMYHVSQQAKSLERIVSLGIRDYCKEEADYADSIGAAVYTDRQMRRSLAEGASLVSVMQEAVGQLPQNVYLSFDIDGLDMSCCPSTGTPVPGGMQFSELQVLLDILLASGKQVVGGDLCEIVCRDPSATDATVGVRVLWEMCNVMIASNIRLVS
jgi:agmatinase